MATLQIGNLTRIMLLFMAVASVAGAKVLEIEALTRFPVLPLTRVPPIHICDPSGQLMTRLTVEVRIVPEMEENDQVWSP